MAKPKRVRETTNPIGAKINTVLAEKGVPGDYSALAKHFGVALTSVYGWVERGRISKDRLPKLAEWSGKPLTWWLDAVDADSQGEEERVLGALREFGMLASPRSMEVINQLSALAQANALKDEDWTLIERLAARFKTN